MKNQNSPIILKIPEHCRPPVCKAEWLYNLLNAVEAKYQGVPVGDYNKLIDRLLEGVDTIFGVDLLRRGQNGKL